MTYGSVTGQRTLARMRIYAVCSNSNVFPTHFTQKSAAKKDEILVIFLLVLSGLHANAALL
jgi:hypothetical protein